MAINRERVYSALFARLAAIDGIETSTRRELSSEDLDAAQQPALILRVIGGSPDNEPGLPTVWTLSALVRLFVKNTSKDGESDEVLNGLIDAIEAALETQDGEADTRQTTLGGLVQRAWVSADVVFGQGESSDQAVAVVPIEMLVTQDD